MLLAARLHDTKFVTAFLKRLLFNFWLVMLAQVKDMLDLESVHMSYLAEALHM